ncbi:O-antigen ligase family protein [uncultured Ramlibacter sp.]|uniref:O-antigen ligase family protein n=1 Tax=uncultured Ramlibacter sp. TaxID=260755 RepID=UPI002616D23F|nr:O-antigen ligase family protein [uncultured Ramlibacter sp.]
MSLAQTLGTTRPAPLLPLARPLDMALGLALAALGLFLPFSTAGVSLSLAALALLALAAAPAVWRSAPWREPTMAMGLLLLAYIAGHTLWSSGFAPPAWRLVNRYHELLMAPILFALFRLASNQRAFLWGLSLSVIGYAAVHWLALLWPELATQLQPRRISAGFILAVSAFLLLELARGNARPWAWRAAAAFLAVTVLFAIDGRTGHLVLLLLAACAAWLHSPRRWRWAAIVVVPALLLLVALGSKAVQQRVNETLAGSYVLQDGSLSSTGIRIELLRNGLDLAQRYGLAGAGFTRYAELHEQSVRERHAADPAHTPSADGAWVRTVNPHNEYLMQLVGGGAVALLLFLAWLVLPMLRKAQSGQVHAALVGASLAFAAGCLFNSLLMDFTEGHFYSVVLAWLLAQTGTTARDQTGP